MLTSRRGTTAALAVAAVALLAAAAVPGASAGATCDPSKNKPVSSQFVKTSGVKFTLGGKPWYFGGTNAVYIINGPDFPESEIEPFFCTQANQGARVVRLAAYLNGYGCKECTKTPNPIQPKVGVFNEGTLQRLDKMVASAKKNGVRLIMTLGNFEDQWGGMQWYVDEVLGSGGAAELSGGDKHLFYTHPKVRDAYKNYARTIISRVNTVTGVAYKDEPTILAWEVLNEPHTKDEYERKGGAVCRDTPGGCVPGKLAYTWIAEMSAYIKTLDPKHLVSTGEEGYRSDGATNCCHNNWVNGGFKGEDFTRNTALPTIDFATVHVYPDHWQIEAKEYDWIGPNYIADRAKVAHAAGKPIIMEEYGMENGYLNRDFLLSYLTKEATANDYAGSLVWAVWSRNVPRVSCSGCSYDFEYGDEGTKAMTDYYAAMNRASAASGSGALAFADEGADATTPSTAAATEGAAAAAPAASVDLDVAAAEAAAEAALAAVHEQAAIEAAARAGGQQDLASAVAAALDDTVSDAAQEEAAVAALAALDAVTPEEAAAVAADVAAKEAAEVTAASVLEAHKA
jgi:mannan endo-1,4-beta-mannosidase